MACSSSVIPRCAVELLFAEDLVQQMVFRHTGEIFKAWRAAPYRDFIYNAFSEDIARAVIFIDTMLEWDVDDAFSRMVDEHRVDKESFIGYALHLKQLFFEQGFDADNFLQFCVKLVSLAVNFATQGLPLALELALFFIMKVMTDYDLFEGGWDTLNVVAKKYIKQRDDFCLVLTPDVSDDDDETMMNVQDDDENEAGFYVHNLNDGVFVVDREEKPDDESDHEMKSESILNSSQGYVLNESSDLAVCNSKKPKEESDRQKMNSFKSDTSAENATEMLLSVVDCKSFIAEEGNLHNKPDREKMGLSDLPDFSQS